MTRVHSRPTLLAAVALIGVLADCVAQAQAPAAAPPSRVSIELRVTWEGELPKPRPFVLPEGFAERRPDEARLCGDCAKKGTLKDESLEVDPATRGIKNVAISVLGIQGDTQAMKPPLLDNKDCRFLPRVAFTPVGRALSVRNADEFVHNARIVGRGGQETWNALLAPGKTAETRPLALSGTYTVFCDVHPWMRATLIATKHPFVAVTGDDGKAVIADLPDGASREIVLWHESLGTARLDLAIPGTGAATGAITQTAFKKP